MADTKPEVKEDTKPETKKSKVAFFKSVRHAGLTLQVQKMVTLPDNSQRQEVDEQETFVQYYDTWKGDVIRVGLLKTESAKIAELARKDENVEEISEKEYNLAVEGDGKTKPLDRAPIPAV